MAGLYFTQFNSADELQQGLIASVLFCFGLFFLSFSAEPSHFPTSDCGLEPAQSGRLPFIINVRQSANASLRGTLVDGRVANLHTFQRDAGLFIKKNTRV